MKKYVGILLAAVLAFGVAGCGKTADAGDEQDVTEIPDVILQDGLPEEVEEIAVVTTSMGTIKLRFYPEEAPKAVENFIGLAKEGYYDGVIFHRVIDNFMIQGGDPTGTGTGGESIWGDNFINEISPRLHFYRGALAMANKGSDNTNGSQFFIVQNPVAVQDALDKIQEARDKSPELGLSIHDVRYSFADIFPDSALNFYKENGGSPELEFLFGNAYTVFGQAFEGLDVVDQIAAVEKNESDRPLTDVVIEKIEIVPYSTEE